MLLRVKFHFRSQRNLLSASAIDREKGEDIGGQLTERCRNFLGAGRSEI